MLFPSMIQNSQIAHFVIGIIVVLFQIANVSLLYNNLLSNKPFMSQL